MKIFLHITIGFISLLLLSSPAFAAQKVALVIGNSQYKNVDDNLKNPVNDAKAIDARLKELGFDTEMLSNANLDSMLKGINRARSKVDANGTLVFYYAGHGVQLDGKNYLVPVDAQMADADRVQREAIQVKEVIDKFNQSSAAVRVLMLDACRNDPFPKTYRSSTRGLAREELQLNKGMMVLYAASQGEVAADGVGSHGTFTEALLQGLSQANIKLPELMDDVTTLVQQKTKNKQNPYYEGTGLARFVFNPQQNGNQSEEAAAVAEAIADPELLYWQSIMNSNKAEDYWGYMEQYPQGRFFDLAKSRYLSYQQQGQYIKTVGQHLVSWLGLLGVLLAVGIYVFIKTYGQAKAIAIALSSFVGFMALTPLFKKPEPQTEQVVNDTASTQTHEANNSPASQTPVQQPAPPTLSEPSKPSDNVANDLSTEENPFR